MAKKEKESGDGVLEQLAKAWAMNLKAIGKALNDMAAAGEPVDLKIRFILTGKYGMPGATARCAMRWAAGEFGDDEQAMMLMGKAPHSTVAQMTVEDIASMLDGKHSVKSPSEGRVVVKTFAEMTPDEVSENISPKGIKPIDAGIKQVPTFRAFRATSYEVLESGEVVFISRGAEPMKMRVPKKLLREVAELELLEAS